MTNIISFILGGILTVLVGWYFYRKSIQKNGITPFLDYFSKVFDHLDPDLKKDLLLQYKGKEIEFLYDIQFTIKNTGNKAIRDVIEPLSLKMPSELEIMDVRLTEIQPKGRQIELEQMLGTNTVKFKFPLLNKDESFKVKLLLKGDISKLLEERKQQNIRSKVEKLFLVEEEIRDDAIIDDFTFSITVDDIPPSLKIKRENPSENSSRENTVFNGIAYLSIGLSIGFVLWTYTHKIQEMYLPNFSVFFDGFFTTQKDANSISRINYLKISLFLTWGTAFVLTMRGFFDFIFPIVRFIVNFVEKKILNS